MNETRRIALEFAMRLNPAYDDVALEIARKFEAYLSEPEASALVIREPIRKDAARVLREQGERP
ncbi:hypothetical protein [Asaia lannensis]|uniref:hypothetical protein n=1 Tax=Asaia lannensis TaxID=415421 RepID=UPI003872F55B